MSESRRDSNGVDRGPVVPDDRSYDERQIAASKSEALRTAVLNYLTYLERSLNAGPVTSYPKREAALIRAMREAL